MNIKVNTSVLESKAAYANRLALQLKEMVSQINRIHSRLDWEVKSRQAIDSSLYSLQQRMEKAEQKMYNISSFLSTTAGRYQATEKTVVANGARLADASSNGVNVGDVGAAKGKSEGKKWYQTNLFKLAVGAVVIGAAVAAAITVGGPILVGMAVGAAIGAAVGGVIGGVSSKISGGSFIDGFSDGFMWGAIGGAATGALEAVGVGMAGIAVGNGIINSSIYVGQTLQNGGHVTIAGLATTFAVGAGLSLLGKVVSSKISDVISKNANKEATEEVTKKVTKEVSNTRLNTYGDALRETLGPANLSHPEEYNTILNHAKEIGAKVEFRPGTLAYDLEFGEPGKLILDPDASIGALRHEYTHMLDDLAAGHPGMRIIADSDTFWKFEYRGYMQELNLARDIKDYDSARFILNEMRARRMEILDK